MLTAHTRQLLEQLDREISFASAPVAGPEVLALDWTEVDAILPDRGLAPGVVEIRAPHALGGGTSLALAAIRAAHLRDELSWCAWVDPDATLYSPGVAMAGVDLHRLIVVRPPRKDLLRITAKVVRSQAFAVVAVDIDPSPRSVAPGRPEARPLPLEVFVRKVALLAAEAGTLVLFLTDATLARPAPLPVALRLELVRGQGTIDVRIGKDRRGRVGLAKTVSFDSKPGLRLTG